MSRRLLFLGTAAVAAGYRTASAQPAFPSRPMLLIVPFGAGGSMDPVNRILARAMSEDLGQPVVVDFKPGAGGLLGADAVAKSRPDGGTFGFIGTSHTISPAIMRSVPFDVENDFAPISLFIASGQALMVNPAVPARDLGELIALAKARPDSLNYGSSGIGSSSHFCGEMLKQAAGIEITHVPFRGSPMTDLIAGNIQVAFETATNAVAEAAAGRVRVLAVTASARLPALPDVPTMRDSGLPQVELDTWGGLAAAARTPPEIVARLNRAVRAAVNNPELAERFASLASLPRASTPEEYAALIRSDVARFRAIARRANIRPE